MAKQAKEPPSRIKRDARIVDDKGDDPMLVFLTGNPSSDEVGDLPTIDKDTYRHAADLAGLADRRRVVGFKSTEDQLALDKLERDGGHRSG